MLTRVKRGRGYGDKLPQNCLCVTRGTHFGNYVGKELPTRTKQVEAFRNWIWQPEQINLRDEFMSRVKRDGIKYVACWCDTDDLCHGDVWLEVYEVLNQ